MITNSDSIVTAYYTVRQNKKKLYKFLKFLKIIKIILFILDILKKILDLFNGTYT